MLRSNWWKEIKDYELMAYMYLYNERISKTLEQKLERSFWLFFLVITELDKQTKSIELCWWGKEITNQDSDGFHLTAFKFFRNLFQSRQVVLRDHSFFFESKQTSSLKKISPTNSFVNPYKPANLKHIWTMRHRFSWQLHFYTHTRINCSLRLKSCILILFFKRSEMLELSLTASLLLSSFGTKWREDGKSSHCK